jgi:hypothetical protein
MLVNVIELLIRSRTDHNGGLDLERPEVGVRSTTVSEVLGTEATTFHIRVITRM